MKHLFAVYAPTPQRETKWSAAYQATDEQGELMFTLGGWQVQVWTL